MPNNDSDKIVSDDGMWEWDGTAWRATTTHPVVDPSVSGSYDLDPISAEYKGSHRGEVVFDPEEWARSREHLQVRGIIMAEGKEREERDNRVPLFVAAIVIGVVALAGALFALVSALGGSAAGDPEDALRSWHNAIVSGDAAGSCAYAAPELFAGAVDATGEVPSCLAVAEIASTTAMSTGGGVLEAVKMGAVDAKNGTVSAEVTYTDSKTAKFDLALDADRGWLIVTMDGGPADLLSNNPGALMAPKGNEASQAEELLAEMESGDAP